MVSGLTIFRCPEYFFGAGHLFAHKSLLEPIVEGFELIKTWPVHGEATGSIMWSSAALGCPSMPDLLYKLRLDTIL